MGPRPWKRLELGSRAGRLLLWLLAGQPEAHLPEQGEKGRGQRGREGRGEGRGDGWEAGGGRRGKKAEEEGVGERVGEERVGGRGGEERVGGRGGRTRGQLGLMILEWAAAGPAAVGGENRSGTRGRWGSLTACLGPRPGVRPGPEGRAGWGQPARSQRGFSPAWRENLRPSYKVQPSSTVTE